MGLADLYVITGSIGAIYLGVSVLLGHLHSGDGGHGDHAHADHMDGGDHAGDQSCDHGGHDTHEGDDLAAAKGGRFSLASLLSPMRIAIFCAFFGLAGFAVMRMAGFLGFLSLIPAIAAGLIISSLLSRLFNWMFYASKTSTNARVDELIGLQAEVSVPIRSGRTGEITCIINSKRFNYPAICQSPEASFPVGSQVMITDINNGILHVQPWDDIVLDISEPVVKRTDN